MLQFVTYIQLTLTNETLLRILMLFLSGDNGKCEEMQELPVYTDQAGVHWQTINGDCSQCERAGQRPAGK